jgi:hypothetical protein
MATTYASGAAYPNYPTSLGSTESAVFSSSDLLAVSSSDGFTSTKPTRVGAYLVNNQHSTSEPNYFRLQVPQNVVPGTTFQFVTGNAAAASRRYTARCPPDSGPGHVLQVALLPDRKPMYKALNRATLTLGLTDNEEIKTRHGGADPMTGSTLHNNRELLKSTEQLGNDALSSPPSTLVVKVPANIEEGMSFVVKTRQYKHFLVKCPKGAKSGMMIRVPVPSEADNLRNMLPLPSTDNNALSLSNPSSKQNKNQQYKFFDIVVPPGATPNQLLPVNVFGKRVPVRLPPTVTEGETITLKVPLQDVVKDIELDYEQVDTSLTGGWNRTIRMEDLKFQWVNSNSHNVSSRSISPTQNAVQAIAFVRNLMILEGNDKRLQTGILDLIPADEAVAESEFRLNPFSKPLVTYANTAHHIQFRSSLEVKQDWLYHHVFEPLKGYSMQDGNKVRLLVRRSSLLADSVHGVLSLSPKQMRKQWQIEFVGEPALDYGGVMRGARHE